jgi:hypothetical protein
MAYMKDPSDRIKALFESHKVPYKRISHRYGGPLALAKKKAFIDIPYQASVMKFYENFVAGVLTLVPSAELYCKLFTVGISCVREHTRYSDILI